MLGFAAAACALPHKLAPQPSLQAGVPAITALHGDSVNEAEMSQRGVACNISKLAGRVDARAQYGKWCHELRVDDLPDGKRQCSDFYADTNRGLYRLCTEKKGDENCEGLEMWCFPPSTPPPLPSPPASPPAPPPPLCDASILSPRVNAKAKYDKWCHQLDSEKLPGGATSCSDFYATTDTLSEDGGYRLCISIIGSNKCGPGDWCLPAPPPPPPSTSGTCFIRGDPHITTFDLKVHSFMGVGVYTLAKVGDLEVQGFLCPAKKGAYDVNVSYAVAMAIKNEGATLLVDENSVATLPDGRQMQPTESVASSGYVNKFHVERQLSDATGKWMWSITFDTGDVQMYDVTAHALTGYGEFAWLSLLGAKESTGLCAQPCAGPNGNCSNPECLPVGNAEVLFDAATIARLNKTCLVQDYEEPTCNDDPACPPGSDARKAAADSCAVLDTPMCHSMLQQCIVDHCSGWTGAVTAYVDGCKEDKRQRTPPPPPPSDEAICKLRGDPHYTTFSNERFSFMGVGVFTLARLRDLEVQTFLCPSKPVTKFFMDTTYSVAVALKKGGDTLVVDENGVVTLPDGTKIQPVNNSELSAGPGNTFGVERFQAEGTKNWMWRIKFAGGALKVRDVPSHAMTGFGEFAWLTLMGTDVRLGSEGLCAQPCAGPDGNCSNPSCQPVGKSDAIFDSATLARLNAACNVDDAPEVNCTAKTLCEPGSDKHKNASLSCAPLDTPKCSLSGLYDDCVYDVCASWEGAADAYLDVCKEDEELSTPPPPAPAPPVENAHCQFRGDPHIITWGNRHYNFQGVGVFTLAKYKGLEVQGFLCPSRFPKQNDAYLGVSWLVALAVSKDGSTLVIDEYDNLTLPDGTVMPPVPYPTMSGLFSKQHFRVERLPKASSWFPTDTWQWGIEVTNLDGDIIGNIAYWSDWSESIISLIGEDVRSLSTGMCAHTCANPEGGCHNTACQRVPKEDVLFDKLAYKRLSSKCLAPAPVCKDDEQSDSKGMPDACPAGSNDRKLAETACASLNTDRCEHMYSFCVTDYCALGISDAPDYYAAACDEAADLAAGQASFSDDSVDLGKGSLDAMSLFGGTDFCCNRCDDDATQICCPSRDAAGKHIMYRRPADPFVEASLCPPCVSTGTCLDGLRIDNIDKSNKPLSLVVTNRSEYSAVWVGETDSGKFRPGYTFTGRKFDRDLTDGMLQINLCSERMLKISACFKNAFDKPVVMKRVSVRILLTDMIGSADPEEVGPKALQFKCSGGTFETFGIFAPYVSHNVGDYIAIEKSFTVHGQMKRTYRCPDNDVVTLWSRRNKLLPDTSLEFVMEAAAVVINFKSTDCADFTFANMPKTLRQTSATNQPNFPSTTAKNGGSPLNSSTPITVADFGLETGECSAVYDPEHPRSRNWMIAVGSGGTNPGGMPW
jgi:hypothetical protein